MAVALTEDMAALIPSEEEEDDVVEVETAELKGSATADYIPVEEGELAVRKGVRKRVRICMYGACFAYDCGHV